ncbi:PREDICTED: protein OBERON 4 [Tarenaya hassleriana]|uniref:protein OBERON 4 n=1 Tax=Tarenaya hassleriana TaxID=28532 RepID=UPI00053C42F1|nr:PREDICTED: protein OBERON 4 [Tarenaya hassleriana]
MNLGLFSSMKRLRSSDDLDSCHDKNVGRETSNSDRPASSSHRPFFHKSSSGKGPISPSRYDRNRQPFMSGDDVGYSRGLSRRRSDRDFDGGFDSRRKDMDPRYREDRLYRSESACFARRDFPKGSRSERDRPRREGNVSSWRRFGGRVKEFGLEERERAGFSLRLRDGCAESKDSRNSRSKSKPLASSSWSKDSGSEQSKSVGNVARKSEEEVQGKSGGRSSEMEEGELEPEPHPQTASGASLTSNHVRDEESIRLSNDHRETEIQSTHREIRKDSEFDDNIGEAKTENNHGELELENSEKKMDEARDSGDGTSVEKVEDVPKQVAELHASENSVNDSATILVSNQTGDCRDTVYEKKTRDMIDDEGEGGKENDKLKLEGNTLLAVAKQFDTEEPKHEKSSDLDVNGAKAEAPKCDEETEQANRTDTEYINMVSVCSAQICKDKGKSVAVTPLDSIGNGALSEGKYGNFANRNQNEDGNLEGPSVRGFELFSSSPVRKSGKTKHSDLKKPKDEKLLLEPLDLSLGLPDVLLPMGGQDISQTPGSPVCSRSVRSLTNTFCTDSECFTLSMSFSGSHSFHHNPSCSLNQNAADNDQSVHSRPIFQGVDWQALSHNDSNNKESQIYQRLMENGNGSIKPQALKGVSDSAQVAEGRIRIAAGSCKGANVLEKQLSFQKCVDVRSPCPSMGSKENGSKLNFEKEKSKEMIGGSISLISSSLRTGGDDFVETVIGYILSDSMHVMAKKFNEMPVRYISSLKESIRQMMLNMDKHVKLHAFQDALQNRTDITLELLKKSHRAQLEILVSLKTGCPEFLQLDNGLSSSDLAEIFMNLRCKNLNCRSLVPVDECDCRVCSRKDGFCSACMCLVCSSFDMASNTCSWVGCDVCLHWCHTDCGLRESFIRNGNSPSGTQGKTEMQFHCVACDHPSEMFGFVKEVFQNFAREWKLERFCKELEYIKRIFSASKDFRGKWLHEAADLMLASVTSKSVGLSEACNRILSFLSDFDSSNLGEAPAPIRNDQSKSSHGMAGSSQDNLWLRPMCLLDKPHHQKRPSKRAEACPVESDVERKELLFEELESIVRIKQAEAEMFQARADDARREAESLKRIAIAKKEKVEEEYMSRIMKLSMGEAEEARSKKHEEFQTMERAHRDYLEMKLRMEEEIKGLLMKMEDTKRSLAL